MRWMEQCAYIAASRVGRGGHLLTGSMDGIAFTQPTRVGDVMYITAQVCNPSAFSAQHRRPSQPLHLLRTKCSLSLGQQCPIGSQLLVSLMTLLSLLLLITVLDPCTCPAS